MAVIPIVLIAIGLAMDAFAVSITSGLAIKEAKVNDALKMALSFGLFQAIMPAVGWWIGIGLRDFISGVDHWIAFGLLLFVGCKMIYEAVTVKPHKREINSLNFYFILVLSIATSIDALAVGVSFALLGVSIILPIIIIGSITFLLSFFGFVAGSKFGRLLGKKVEIAGGIVLISIGIKILADHLL